MRVIAFSNVTSSSNRARVAGIRVARAPIVALAAEDHSFPEPRIGEHCWPRMPRANGRPSVQSCATPIRPLL